jgi:hypothetical protein
MSKRRLGSLTVAVCVLLVVLGAHREWKRYRYHLRTAKGTIWVGMARAEVEAVLGPPLEPRESKRSDCAVWSDPGRVLPPAEMRAFLDSALVPEAWLGIDYDESGLLMCARYRAGGIDSLELIPRPSLFEHVRSWLSGGKPRF